MPRSSPRCCTTRSKTPSRPTRTIEQHFGRDVAELVDGVTKLTNLQLSSTESKQAENFRKLFMAMSKDLRVILVKIADRLHNMRTIRHMRPEKQAQKSRETMDIYAPLAGRMGMQWMREELEDLAFHVLNPDARASIIRRFIRLQRESGDVINKITTDIRKELDKAGIEADVFGRAKKPYSIWRKMQEKDQPFSRLSDIYGFRVITHSEMDCYRVLGVIHQRWRAVPGRFKDYISQPKSNGYRSIHTTVSGRDGKRVEVQIRTREMHEVAEAGRGRALVLPRRRAGRKPLCRRPGRLARGAHRAVRLRRGHDDFLEHVKLEMYSDQVFCFTPKGEVVKLPRGATPLDFAYAIHTRIGDSCVGAKVDGIRVPLWTRIKNGQSVEIITAEGQTPAGDLARHRRHRPGQDRRSGGGCARRTASATSGSAASWPGWPSSMSAGKATDKALKTAAKQLSLPDADELLARLGSAELAARDVVAALYPEAARERR